MKKLAFIGAVALGCVSLAGCAGLLPSASASPQSALVAANSFDALETVATGYLELPHCATSSSAACRNASAVASIVPAVRTGRTARNQIEALLQANNGGAIPLATYNTLSASIATLEAVYAQYSISTTSAK